MHHACVMLTFNRKPKMTKRWNTHLGILDILCGWVIWHITGTSWHPATLLHEQFSMLMCMVCFTLFGREWDSPDGNPRQRGMCLSVFYLAYLLRYARNTIHWGTCHWLFLLVVDCMPAQTGSWSNDSPHHRNCPLLWKSPLLWKYGSTKIALYSEFFSRDFSCS